jgi:putative hemolysin
MIWMALGLATVGVFFNAFYSGAETGFYRANRLRLVLDAMGGDRVSQALLWVINRPSLFVATTLLGTNLAAYLMSLAVVIGTEAITAGPSPLAEVIATLALTPVFFVYGELVPKYFFLHAPNRLLRRAGTLLLVSVGLFAPFSLLVWALSKLVEWLSGESPERVRVRLARGELSRVLEEGHEAGILYPAQRALARGIFAVAAQPVARFALAEDRLPRARATMTKEEVLSLARRYNIAIVPVESPQAGGGLVGYYRVIDLALSSSDELGPWHPMIEIREETTHLAALMQMQGGNESLARVIDARGKAVGIIHAERLREPLFRAR